MADPRWLAGIALVAAAAFVVLVALLVVGVVLPGPRRAGLLAGGVPLALVPPAVAAVYASGRLTGLFGGMPHPDGPAALVAACGSLWLVQRAAWGVFAAACLLGFLLALVRRGRAEDGVTCSPRRGAVLALVPLAGLLLAFASTREVTKALRVTSAVMAEDRDDPESRARTAAVLRAEGLPVEGSGSVGATANFIARATLLGTFGGATVVVVLGGLAFTGLLLAWRVRFGGVFLAFAAALWLLCALGGSLVSAGIASPLRL